MSLFIQSFAHPPISGAPRSLSAIRASQGRRMKMALRTVAKLEKPSKKVSFGFDLCNLKPGDHEILKARITARTQSAGAVVESAERQPKRPIESK